MAHIDNIEKTSSRLGPGPEREKKKRKRMLLVFGIWYLKIGFGSDTRPPNQKSDSNALSIVASSQNHREDDNMIYDHRYVLRTHPIAREQWAIYLSHGSVSVLEWGPTLTAHLKFDPPLAPLQSQKLLSAKLPKKWCRVSTSQWRRKKISSGSD